jgi:hypothetical protein
MIHRILALAAIAILALGPPAATPAFAQAQVGITGYIGTNGAKAAVRPSTPLPTYNIPHALPASQWNYAGATGGIVNTTAVALKAASGAGVRNYLTGVQYFNSAAVASEIEIRDGSTVIWRGFVPASMTVPVQINFTVPLRGTANTALNVALATTATATRVSAQGYTSTN